MPNPLVSVVLPAFNHEAFVGAAIESVLRQSVADWELIAIDDGSTDGTLHVLRQYTDARIRVIPQVNAGSHAAINRGFVEARGKYLAVLNSDDVYHQDRLKRLLETAATMEGNAFVCSAVRPIDHLNHPLDAATHWWPAMYAGILKEWDENVDAPLGQALATLLWGNLTVSTSNFFLSRGVLQRCGRLGHFRYVLDWEYALRVARRMPECFAFLRHEVLLDYRMHGENTILRNPIRNHLEAGFIIRRAVANLDGGHLWRAVQRMHNLDRFIRKRESYVRDEAFARLRVEHTIQTEVLKGTREHVAKVEALLRAKDERVYDLEQERAGLKGQLAKTQAALDAAVIHAQAREEQLTQTQALLRLTEEHVRKLDDQIARMIQSRSWRLTRPLRWGARQARLARSAAMRLNDSRKARGSLMAAALGALDVLRAEGLGGLRRRIETHARPVGEVARPGSEDAPAPAVDDYRAWVAQQSMRIEKARHDAAAIIDGLAHRTLFSVVVPVYNTSAAMLQSTLDSVRAQIYPHWTLCIADDASTLPHVRQTLLSFGSEDARCRIAWRTENGHICAATNSALELAEGEFVVFLDHDDELAPHALLTLAQHISQFPDAAFIYSDDDKISETGIRSLPLFKPDWSPALAWTQNYIGHLVCARTELVRRAGGMRPGMEGAQDYDLVLRLSRVAKQIDHIPDVLYHWRMHSGSTASNAGAKSYAHEAGKRAVESYLRDRYGDRLLAVEDGTHRFTYSPRFRLPPDVRVSIIVPTRDKGDLLRDCVDSILRRSSWQRLELIIVDNNSSEARTFALFEELRARDSRVRVVSKPIPFNWSRLNNLVADESSGEVLVFLNNDTAVVSADWIERLAEVALLPDVGTVGPLLLFGDGTIQHAGVVVGMGGWADHVYRGCVPAHHPSPYISPVTTRNVLANTGACMAIERSKFEALGRFDEAFTVCGSDVELGLRVHKKGWQNVYLASVRLTHFESKTRGPDVPDADFAESDRKYAPYRTGGDPFYNPNLSLSCTTPVVDANPTRINRSI